MKNYQKPMVNVEMINVEDVITTSSDPIVPADDFSAATGTLSSALGGTPAGTTDNATIVFEW